MAEGERVELNGEWTPLYSKCPCCGFDLNKIPEPLADKVNAEQAKCRTRGAKLSFVALAHKALAPYFLYVSSKWVVFPFSKTKKNATKRNK
ncbi:hypothetical protein [Serratia sp. M24T3]|uniref:hypothetical protein n=1 Tax=Serratia sp. M24T3 TaxID=932213 RepID=UPI001ED90D94|nr:hypothetical protein [Serratia sp. M24T3]